jgi:Gas vesicle synthesis protein GvpL/GvpF
MTTAVDASCYVFGIVPADAPLPEPDDEGPAADLELISAGAIAALVGVLPPDRPLGRAADLRAHDRVLSELVAAGTPVLPMRFGAVLVDRSAVVAELLVPHQDRFRDGLEAIRGRVQYTLKVRYEQDAVLRDVLRDHPEIERLRGDPDQPGSTAAKIRLGELVVRALERRRGADASRVLADLVGTADVRMHDPSAPEDVLDAAFLVDADHADEFADRVSGLAEQHAGRLRFRLLGPSAAYDFVGDG